ncbi:MAG: flavodoxin family protein [Chloroflexota bacterium]
MTTPVITALVCSARRRGNAYALADHCLAQLRQGEYRRTRLLNFFEYDVQACQHCDYQCLGDPPDCPLKDDVAWLWDYTWRSDAVIWAVPTYGGAPPAIWMAFMQRLQSLWPNAPARRIPLAVICIANPDGATGGEATAETLRRQASERWWQLVDFAVISAHEHGRDSKAGDLAEVPAVRQRLDEVCTAILEAVATDRR